MKLAVKFYGEVENPDQLPNEWPAEVKELQDEEQVPDGYTEMTREAYEQYRRDNKPAYDDYVLNHPEVPPEKLVLRDLILDIKTAILNQDVTVLDKHIQVADKDGAVLEKDVVVNDFVNEE